MQIKSDHRGFALVETLLVGVILIPILFAVLTTGTTASSTVSTTQTAAEANESVRRIAERLSRSFRPASMTSLKVYSGGSWITPASGTEYKTLRYGIVEKLPSSNRTNVGAQRELRFVLDHNEKANGVDDDGDGYVDEGRIEIVNAGTTGSAMLVGNCEKFSIKVTGRLLEFEIQAVRKDNKGRAQRFKANEIVYLRNN